MLPDSRRLRHSSAGAGSQECLVSVADCHHSSERRVFMNVSGSTALVSGGSSGLGGACVRLLAENGANVAILDVNQQAGEKLAADLGERVRFVKTDVTDEQSVKHAVDAAVRTFGGL